MNAAMPPAFWALATACSANDVLPDDSGPYISTMRPRGRPPKPSATSSAIEPVGITSTGTRVSSPRRMIEPLPNWRSIWSSADSRAFSLSPARSTLVLVFPAIWGLPAGVRGLRAPSRTAQVVFVVVPPVIPGGSVDTLRVATDISAGTASRGPVRGDFTSYRPRHQQPWALR